jgi:prevent-host-death family protein
MVKLMVMSTPMAEAKKNFCELVARAERGETIVILRHGKPAARLTPMPARSKPWRMAIAEDPAKYKGIDLNEPILDEI